MSNQVQCPNCGGYRVSIQDQGFGVALLYTILLGGFAGLLSCVVLLISLEDIFDALQSGMFWAGLIWVVLGWGPIILVSRRRKPYLLKCDLCGKEWDQRTYVPALAPARPAQVSTEIVAPTGKPGMRAVGAGIIASFVASTIWIVLLLLLFEESRGLLIKNRSVAGDIAVSVLVLGGLVLIFFAAFWPIRKAVRGLRGIIGGLLVGFVGFVAGITAGAIIITIIFSLVSP